MSETRLLYLGFDTDTHPLADVKVVRPPGDVPDTDKRVGFTHDSSPKAG